MRRLLALLLALACFAFALAQDPDSKGLDWDPAPQSNLTFMWSNPSLYQYKVSHGQALTFEIHTYIFVHIAEADSEKIEVDARERGQEGNGEDVPPSDDPPPSLEHNFQPEPEHGYHDVPYHALPEHAEPAESSRVARLAGACSARAPAGWSATDNPAADWHDSVLHTKQGLALNLVLSRQDVKSANLSGCPLLVVRTRTGQTALKSYRRMSAGQYELTIDAERQETYRLVVNDPAAFSEAVRMTDAEGASRTQPAAFGPSFADFRSLLKSVL